jgi:hypothetical protein
VDDDQAHCAALAERGGGIANFCAALVNLLKQRCTKRGSARPEGMAIDKAAPAAPEDAKIGAAKTALR